MNYTYSDVDGNETIHPDIGFVKEVLQRPYSYWLQNGGDSAIQVSSKERLIFFKLEQGVFIMQHPDYLSPVITLNKKAEAVVHYVGGEPMVVPDICLCDEATSFEIIGHYILSNGLLTPSYQWTDIYELIEDGK